jgi:hypothetical protein
LLNEERAKGEGVVGGWSELKGYYLSTEREMLEVTEFRRLDVYVLVAGSRVTTLLSSTASAMANARLVAAPTILH